MSSSTWTWRVGRGRTGLNIQVSSLSLPVVCQRKKQRPLGCKSTTPPPATIWRGWKLRSQQQRERGERKWRPKPVRERLRRRDLLTWSQGGERTPRYCLLYTQALHEIVLTRLSLLLRLSPASLAGLKLPRGKHSGLPFLPLSRISGWSALQSPLRSNSKSLVTLKLFS